MGTTLSATIGFGLEIPQEFIENTLPLSAGDLSVGEWLEDELKKYPGLAYSNPYFYDYSEEYVVWVEASIKTFYGAHVHSTDMTSHFVDADDALELYRFAEDHGIDYANAGIKIEVSVG